MSDVMLNRQSFKSFSILECNDAMILIPNLSTSQSHAIEAMSLTRWSSRIILFSHIFSYIFIYISLPLFTMILFSSILKCNNEPLVSLHPHFLLVTHGVEESIATMVQRQFLLQSVAPLVWVSVSCFLVLIMSELQWSVTTLRASRMVLNYEQ